MLFASYKQAPKIVSPQRWIEFGDLGGVVVKNCGPAEASQQGNSNLLTNPVFRMILAVFPAAVASLEVACKENKEKFEEAFPLTVSFVEQRTKTHLKTNKAKVCVSVASRTGNVLSSADFEFEGGEISELFKLTFARILREFNHSSDNSFAFKFDRRFFIIEVCGANQATEFADHSNEKPFLSCYIYPYSKIELNPTSKDQKKMYAFSILIEATLLVSNSGEAEFKILPRADDYTSAAEKSKLSEPNSSSALADLVCQTCSFCTELGVPAPKKCMECDTCAKYI